MTNHSACDVMGVVPSRSAKSSVLVVLFWACASQRPVQTPIASRVPAPVAKEAKAHPPAAPGAEPTSRQAPSRGGVEPRSLNASQEQLYRRACELGSALACNELGVLVEADPKQAMAFFEKACGLELPRGCTNLGVLLMNDTSHQDRIIELLRGSCDQEDGLACNKLGDWLYSVDSDPKKLDAVYRLYERGCALGNWDACTSAAWMQKDGAGTTADATLARNRFELACNHQCYRGCLGLGISLLEENPPDPQRDHALSLIEKSCANNLATACYLHGMLSVSQDGTIPNAARRQFERACQLGDERGCPLVSLDALPEPTEDDEP